MAENDINVTALISCKNKELSFCWNENTRLYILPIFVLSVQYPLDRYSSICSAKNCPLEVTADDYFVTSNGAVYNAIQAAYIVLRIVGYFKTRFMPTKYHQFCLLPSGYFIVCFVHVSVCASVQLEMHRPENTNKFTDVWALTCATFHFIFDFYCFFI